MNILEELKYNSKVYIYSNRRSRDNAMSPIKSQGPSHGFIKLIYLKIDQNYRLYLSELISGKEVSTKYPK